MILSGAEIKAAPVDCEPNVVTVKAALEELSETINRLNDLSEAAWKGICAGEAPSIDIEPPFDLPTTIASVRQNASITVARLEFIVRILGVR